MKMAPGLRSFLLFFLLCNFTGYDPGEYISPSFLTIDRKGESLFITEFTANKIAVYDLKNAKPTKEYLLNDSPSGLALSDDELKLFVTAGAENGKLYIIDLTAGVIKDVIPVGHTPNSPVFSKTGNLLYVNNQFNNDISVVDINLKEVITRIPVLREPVSSVITPDGKFLYVANLLPSGPADIGSISSAISVIDLSTNELVKNIELPNGSNGVNGITISPDGKFVYAVHILGRYQMPTTQLERGWMNTNAMSIINADNKSLLNTVLLDDTDLGAANPWGVVCTDDGNYICVSHAGVHEISIIDRKVLHNKLRDVEAGMNVAGRTMKPEDVKNDLAFVAGLRRRVKLTGLGPRGIAVFGHKVYAAEYFSESIGIVDIDDKSKKSSYSIKLSTGTGFSPVRRGEFLFHDAEHCFQQWQSCSSCHPGGGRSDALNWDLLNDGVGNPKNSKNLLLAHKTPPAMITGIRDKAETAVRAGIKYIQFAYLPDEDARAIDEYLKSLQPVVSPYLVEGQLSDAAKRGEKIFSAAKCVDCHSGPLYTNLQKYNVGTGKGNDKNVLFDTPTLIENWRTAPYLYDGRAENMKEVVTTYNSEDKHGSTSNLSEQEINDLVEFILSQ